MVIGTKRIGVVGCLCAAGAIAALAACSKAPGAGTQPGASAQPAASPQPAPAAQPADAPPALTAPTDLPARIVAKRGGFVPEGLEFDAARKRFLTGSLAEGTVFQIGADGTVTPFVTDTDLVSSVGIEVDAAHNRLLVCDSDRAVLNGKSKGQAKLGIYALESGKRIALVDLAKAERRPPADAQYFANDVAAGADGTAYVTDSRRNVVYAVGPDLKPRVLFRFEAKDEQPLNGIVAAPDGNLIVIGGSHLFRLKPGDPAKMNEIGLPAPIEGADGMVFLPDGRLAVVSNSKQRVVLLTSGDNWYNATAAGMQSFGDQATTAAVAEGALYVVHPHFNDRDPPVIERVLPR